MSITYEKLFEILRNEKNHEDLQKLDESFFDDVKAYVEEKMGLLSEKTRLNQFMDGFEQEQTALRTQIYNIRKLVRDIVERRERKIIDMAINKAKTGSNIIDTSSLLPEERLFFEHQIKTITNFRTEVVDAILRQKTAVMASEGPTSDENQPKELNMAPSEPGIESLKKVQILENVPKFVGIDLEIYGPFSNSEEVSLREEIAEMLIKTNKARLVEG